MGFQEADGTVTQGLEEALRGQFPAPPAGPVDPKPASQGGPALESCAASPSAPSALPCLATFEWLMDTCGLNGTKHPSPYCQLVPSTTTSPREQLPVWPETSYAHRRRHRCALFSF